MDISASPLRGRTRSARQAPTHAPCAYSVWALIETRPLTVGFSSTVARPPHCRPTPIPPLVRLGHPPSMVQYYLLSGIDGGFLVGTFLLYVASKGASMIYYAYFSPLSGIPGPWYAAISDIYALVVAARLVQCNTIHSLFVRYGPIVRIGPRRVVFCDRLAMKSVYCIHKLEKSTFYKALIAYVAFLPLFEPPLLKSRPIATIMTIRKVLLPRALLNSLKPCVKHDLAF